MPIQQLITILFLSLLFTACQGQTTADVEANSTAGMSEPLGLQSENPIYKRVDNATFKSKMKDKEAVILDVRTKRETDRGVIGNATLIDFRADDFQSQLNELARDKTYLLYCQSGGRSARAAMLMQQMGFEEIYELKNGYGGWKE